MPLFEYKCQKCGFLFEELKNTDDSDPVSCRKCGSETKKMISTFAPKISGGSTNETVDMSIGREADKRWQQYHDRQSIRQAKGVDLGPVATLPKTKDGKYMPVMALGEKKEVSQRKEYVSALQEHRADRVKKGIPQFSGTGDF